jgi:ubiquinone/menaquinone biosynthesis C-methylase UbiE
MKYKTDISYIKNQYNSDENLKRRIQLYDRYSTNRIGWYDWLYAKYNIQTNSRILDVGCGNSIFWKSELNKIPDGTKVLLSDISIGMINCSMKNLGYISEGEFTFCVFDICHIPFKHYGYDLVLANHMLYHVPDIDQALYNISSILQPNGKFFASTIGKNHMKEISDWVLQFDLPVNINSTKLSENFGLQNGEEMLRKYFKSVILHPFDDNLIVDAVSPILDFMKSLSNPVEFAKFPKEFMAFEQHLNTMLRKSGKIIIQKQSGLFEANNI